MTIYFADTSAIAKRYLPETGAAWVQSWIDPKTGNLTVISALGTVEFISLLARRQREGNIAANDFNKLRRDFLFHVYREYRVIALSANVIFQARRLVANHPLRALDALQLASAMATAQTIGSVPLFVSADQRLLAIARAEGFTTDDPNAHL